MLVLYILTSCASVTVICGLVVLVLLYYMWTSGPSVTFKVTFKRSCYVGSLIY